MAGDAARKPGKPRQFRSLHPVRKRPPPSGRGGDRREGTGDVELRGDDVPSHHVEGRGELQSVGIQEQILPGPILENLHDPRLVAQKGLQDRPSPLLYPEDGIGLLKRDAVVVARQLRAIKALRPGQIRPHPLDLLARPRPQQGKGNPEPSAELAVGVAFLGGRRQGLVPVAVGQPRKKTRCQALGLDLQEVFPAGQSGQGRQGLRAIANPGLELGQGGQGLPFRGIDRNIPPVPCPRKTRG